MSEIEDMPVDGEIPTDEPQDGEPQTEVDFLTAELERLMADNNAMMHDHNLSLGRSPVEQRLNMLTTQVRVLIDMMTDSPEERVMFDIACQRMIGTDLQTAIEEIKAAEARAALTGGVDVLNAEGAVDLSVLKQGNRAQRRQAARDVAKDLLRKDG